MEVVKQQVPIACFAFWHGGRSEQERGSQPISVACHLSRQSFGLNLSENKLFRTDLKRFIPVTLDQLRRYIESAIFLDKDSESFRRSDFARILEDPEKYHDVGVVGDRERNRNPSADEKIADPKTTVSPTGKHPRDLTASKEVGPSVNSNDFDDSKRKRRKHSDVATLASEIRDIRRKIRQHEQELSLCAVSEQNSVIALLGDLRLQENKKLQELRVLSPDSSLFSSAKTANGASRSRQDGSGDKDDETSHKDLELTQPQGLVGGSPIRLMRRSNEKREHACCGCDELSQVLNEADELVRKLESLTPLLSSGFAIMNNDGNNPCSCDGDCAEKEGRAILLRQSNGMVERLFNVVSVLHPDVT